MSLKETNLNKRVVSSINNWNSKKICENIYLSTTLLTGSGKTTLLNKAKDYCEKNNISYYYIKNLCSMIGGVKSTNKSKANLKLVINSIHKMPSVFLCDEVKDKYFYELLGIENLFISTGYDVKGDLGEKSNKFTMVNIDNQFTKREIFKILKKKYPKKDNKILKKIVKQSPNIGQSIICLEQLGNRLLTQEDLEVYFKNLNDKNRCKNEDTAHYLLVERFDGHKTTILRKTI